MRLESRKILWYEIRLYGMTRYMENNDEEGWD